MEDIESSEPLEPLEASGPWFAGRSGEVLIFKINRRPLRSGLLAPFEPPADLFEHLELVLKAGTSWRSGHRHQRDWHIGNLRFEGGRYAHGRIGWLRKPITSLENEWDEASASFVEHPEERQDNAVSPFVVDTSSELVGVLKHPTFSTEDTVNRALQAILNAGEKTLDNVAVEWNVDPVGDTEAFAHWFETTDQVLSLTVTIKRPNGDLADDFAEVERQLDEYEAELIREQIKARDAGVGLNKAALVRDEGLWSRIRAAMRSYGDLKGKGLKGGEPTSFDQTKAGQLRETVDDVGADWETAEVNVLKAVERARRAASRGEST